MTRKYETELVTVQREKLVSAACDWCGGTVEDARGYDTRGFTLEFTKGEEYPEGGDKHGWQVEDLCDGCVDQLHSLLLDNGINISTVDRSW